MKFLLLFAVFCMIGAVTFGGGLAMMPLILQEVSANWGQIVPDSVLMNFVAISESTPGPFAVNMATYVGAVVGGHEAGIWQAVLGAFCSTMGVVVPSFVIILLVAQFYERFKNSRIVKGCMTGLKPAAVGLIGNAVLQTLLKVFVAEGQTFPDFTAPGFYISLGLFGVFAVMAFKKVHPILIVCISAAAGILFGYLRLL